MRLHGRARDGRDATSRSRPSHVPVTSRSLPCLRRTRCNGAQKNVGKVKGMCPNAARVYARAFDLLRGSLQHQWCSCCIGADLEHPRAVLENLWGMRGLIADVHVSGYSCLPCLSTRRHVKYVNSPILHMFPSAAPSAALSAVPSAVLI